MKDNIICMVVVNIICVGFIMLTVFLQFGTDIKVMRKVESLPIEVGYTHSTRRSTAGRPVSVADCKVKVAPDSDDIDSFWVDAKDVFGTDDEDELEEIIEDEDTIKLNIFINPETDEVLGVTTKGTSRWALIYQNNKLVKYGSVLIPCVDVFVILIMLLFGKKKKAGKPGARNKESASFDTLPDLKNYRIYLFLKAGEVSEVKAHLDEYHELYITEAAFSTDLYKLGDTAWTYVVLTLLPGVAEISPAWEYLNILLWMSDKAERSFAYAYSRQKGEPSVIAERDWGDQLGESCKGIIGGKYFHASIPGQEVTWKQGVPKSFEHEEYIRKEYGVDVRLAQ